ncbi:MAG TPA: histidine kinase, partial [Thermoanaerobaculia bacterium]|nr:histidine kinase [Thermoanaerobaculia bacterium]
SKRNLAVTIAAIVAFAILRSATDVALAEVMYDRVPPSVARAIFLAVFHTHILLGGLVIAIATFGGLRHELAERQQREARAERALAEITLHQLRADLHPHFLFNTLNAVAALLHTDPAAAERTISALSDLLRRSFHVTERLEIPVAEELEFLERYLALQKTRFGDRLSSHIQVDDDDLLRAAVPPMVLQPLIENAILHGVTKRAAGGVVEVHVRAAGDLLHIEVRDDGVGTDPATIFERGNIGIRNTAARLASLYRERQSLTFRREGRWFVAEVVIPLSWPETEMIAS